jgi:hypothetical protein
MADIGCCLFYGVPDLSMRIFSDDVARPHTAKGPALEEQTAPVAGAGRMNALYDWLLGSSTQVATVQRVCLGLNWTLAEVADQQGAAHLELGRHTARSAQRPIAALAVVVE